MQHLEGGIGESAVRRGQVWASDMEQVRTQAAMLRLELTKADEQFGAVQDRVDREEIRAPMDGVINRRTVGGVIRSGELVAKIVPSASQVIIEARIAPEDRGYIWPGLSAHIKISAYASTGVGSLEAKVGDISPDAIQDPRGGLLYRVRLDAGSASLGPGMPVIPGMTGEVAVRSGSQTALIDASPARMIASAPCCNCLITRQRAEERMLNLVRSGTAFSAGLVLASFTPVAVDASAAFALLDPIRLAASACGNRAQQSVLRARLRLAATLSSPISAVGAPMPLYTSLAATRLKLTGTNAEAARFFNQGLLLTYGFNHAGAVRSFRAAQRIDPACALCWWGEALALGPNINAPMDERDQTAALAALARAQELAHGSSPLEQALIAAMAQRYAPDAGPETVADRAALDGAYADAMLAAAARFPADNEVAVLAAEAIMDTSPWNYWQADKRSPIGRSGEAVRLVEAVLARDPGHLQAAHLYVHLLENSADPQRAETAADQLAKASLPEAGHLIHMPSHIYVLLGRYRDSIRVNVAAARSDEALIRRTGDHSLLRYGYYPHNIHFIVASAQMAGDMRTAIREAGRLRAILDPETSARLAWVQAIDAAPYLAMAQFARPEAILAMPPADVRLPYAAAMRLYARAVAEARLQNTAGVERELAALADLRESQAFAGMIEQGVPATDLLTLADAVARGRLAFAKQHYAAAAEHYRQAISLEAKIPYQEPTYWYYPVRQSLGAALYKQGRHADASEAFRGALLQTPLNGWALYGLAESEAAQGHVIEAAAARQALRSVWLGPPNLLRMDRL